MRILYLITSDISARFLRGQLAFLIEAGHEVHVGTRLSNPPATFDPGVVVHDLAYEREPSLLADLRAFAATARLVRRVRPDAVNASTPKAGLLGMLAARVCRVPKRVYVVRGLRFETLTGARRLVFRVLERLATACATDVVYNSPSLRAVAERERAVRRARGVVLGGGSGNGIDPARFVDLPSRHEARQRLGLDDDVVVVGFVGRLTRDKGVADLVEAVGQLQTRSSLLLVGDFEDGDALPDVVRDRIESDRQVLRRSWTDHPATVYRAIDVLAFPSYREGLPNVPLEAQLCGTPVVAYASTGTVDAVMPAEPNVLVVPGDILGLCQGIEHALQSRSSISAKHWVLERFDQQALWRGILDVYVLGCDRSRQSS